MDRRTKKKKTISNPTKQDKTGKHKKKTKTYNYSRKENKNIDTLEKTYYNKMVFRLKIF